ncbi:RAS protein activator like-3-like isoform X1 [Solea senegalensis]|uniref:RAS protein activator like-3-like isoform X1 n=1 Tax=Solea senegalensis TaxID=28829 RepID=A0AAV6PG47_SOLSE|nr:ras GTPase-activating protein nGAP [Solea senegalensis]KAG7457261.1 RAS protein activator like-3-like isoform X1 [Solea senegalensis]
MGTEEKDSESAAQLGSSETEKECPVETPPGQTSDASDPLNTYRWHTGSKGTLNEGEAAAASPSSTMDKIQKASTNKWNKMQNWRKALSEDTGDKNSSGGKSGDGGKPDKGRKNPFRRAMSEPPGSLFSVLSPSSSAGSSAHAAASSSSAAAAADASGVSTADASQRAGGGMLLKKYLRTVSQKLKRPRLQSRNSASALLPDMDEVNPPSELPRLHWPQPQEVPLWDISKCVLEEGQILISPEEEPTMWTRNRFSSCLSNISMQNLVDIDAECSPDHVGLSGGPRPKSQDGGVRALIKRRIQENRAKRNSNTQPNSIGLIKGSRYGSRESVSIPVNPLESLDLSADITTVIRPVHSSILGEKYCFEVINSESTHCFGCSSAAERDRWIEDLRRAAQPNKDNIERTENSLCLWINEAKDLPPKRRYYCEVHLDGTLFARTSSRAVGKPSNRSSLADGSSTGSSGGVGASGGVAGGCQLFWGEFFELDNLPCVSQITLHLFRDDDPKKKRHSKDETSLHPLGSMAIPLADIRGRTYQEKWYPITPYKASGSAGSKDLLGAQTSLRIKARFQNLKVLPMEKYKEFAEYVTVDYVEMCRNLEPLLNVKEKEELAGALVHVLQSIGKAKEFLIDLGSAEVERLGEREALIFRENTLATKAIDEYMKLVGQKYLIDTLGDFITRLYASMENCEVDPRKCPATELSNNQKHLKDACDEVVQKIIEIHGPFPEELHKIFSSWMELCEDRSRPEIGQRLISASLFLRFLCPAILSPSLFGLTQPYPETNTLRTLTLTAKVIQNLANFTLFGEKEEYMLFMNEFLEQHWNGMRGFLQTVSSLDTEIPMTSFDGYVDLPLRLAVLHGLLVDIIHLKDQDTIDKLDPLPSILNQITESLGPEAPRIMVRSNPGQVKPMYVPPKDLGKYSPHQSSLQQLPVEAKGIRDGDVRTRKNTKERTPIKRTHSAPHRPTGHAKRALKRQTSSEALPTTDHEQEMETNQPLISPPNTSASLKRTHQPVPWIKNSLSKESSEMKTENEQINLLDRHGQELSELRLGIEQVTERELDMAKRLEDFIIQSQDQNAMLLAEVTELRSMLALREEQLTSATFRLGVIEEEREEDERKLSVAVAAVDRMNVLEEQFAGMLRDLHQLSEVYNSSPSNAQRPDKQHINST